MSHKILLETVVVLQSNRLKHQIVYRKELLQLSWRGKKAEKQRKLDGGFGGGCPRQMGQDMVQTCHRFCVTSLHQYKTHLFPEVSGAGMCLSVPWVINGQNSVWCGRTQGSNNFFLRNLVQCDGSTDIIYRMCSVRWATKPRGIFPFQQHCATFVLRCVFWGTDSYKWHSRPIKYQSGKHEAWIYQKIKCRRVGNTRFP